MLKPDDVAKSLAKRVKDSAAILEQQIDAQLAKTGNASIDIDKLDGATIDYLKHIYELAGWKVTTSSGDQRDWWHHMNIQLHPNQKRGFNQRD
jgi:phosphoglucomutase